MMFRNFHKARLHILLIAAFLVSAAPKTALALFSWDSPEMLPLNGTVSGGYSEENPSYNYWHVTINSDGLLGISTEFSGGGYLYKEIYAIDDFGELYGANIQSVKQSADQTISYYCLQAGSYMVIVRNHMLDTLNYTITSTYESASHGNDTEPNDSYTQGIPIGPDTNTTGHLGYVTHGFGSMPVYNIGDSVDWWTITIEDSGLLEITTVSDTTLIIDYVACYDSELRNIVLEKPNQYVTMAEHQLIPGTYYIKVQLDSGFGSYNFDTTLASPIAPSAEIHPEPNDAWDKASSLVVDGTVTGHMGYLTAGGVYPQYDMDDWWSFSIPNSGYVTVNLYDDDPLEIKSLWLYDSERQLMHNAERGDNEPSLGAHIAAGNYFVRLMGKSGYGHYVVTTSYSPAAAAGDPEPNDSMQTASTMTSQEVNGHLGYDFGGGLYLQTDGIDWWKQDTTENGTLTCTVTCDESLSATVDLYDDSGTLLAIGSINGHTASVSYHAAAASSYYVRVYHQSGVGGYVLSASVDAPAYPNDAEPNDTTADAETIPPNHSGSGHLGFRSHTHSDAGDYYTFTAQSALENLYISLVTEESLVAYLQLYDATGASIAYVSAGGQHEVNMHRTNVPAGAYYMQIRHNSGAGGYRFMVTNDPENTMVLDPPQNFSVALVNGGIGSSWTASPDEATGAIASYRLYRSRVDNWTEYRMLDTFSGADGIALWEETRGILITTVMPGSGVYGFLDSAHTGGGIYFYRLEALGIGSETAAVSASVDLSVSVAEGAPATFSVSPPYPNPFNAETTIRFNIPQGSEITLDIYNIAGQKICTLASGHVEAGVHSVRWDGMLDSGGDAASGIYIARLRAGNSVGIARLMLVR